MVPYANKTLLIRFLRKRGYDVAKPTQAKFSKLTRRHAYWLEYQDSTGIWHTAYYSAAAGRPIFSINGNFIRITVEEVVENYLYQLKGRTDSK